MRRISLSAIMLIGLCSTTAFAQQKAVANYPEAQKVEALLSKMTLEEKIGQLNQYTSDRLATGPLTPNSSKYQEIKDGKVGSMLNI